MSFVAQPPRRQSRTVVHLAKSLLTTFYFSVNNSFSKLDFFFQPRKSFNYLDFSYFLIVGSLV